MSGTPKVQSLWCSSCLPFSSGTIQKGYVSGCGRLIAQMLHWKDVVEQDVKWTPLSDGLTTKSHSTYWRGMAFQLNSGCVTLHYPTSKSKCLCRLDIKTSLLSSLIFTEHL